MHLLGQLGVATDQGDSAGTDQPAPESPSGQTAAVTPPLWRTNEEADRYLRIRAFLGWDWRVIECRDGIQWILQLCRGTSDSKPRWRNVVFCRTLNGLMTRVRESLGDEYLSELGELPPLSNQRLTAPRSRQH